MFLFDQISLSIVFEMMLHDILYDIIEKYIYKIVQLETEKETPTRDECTS